MDQAYKPDRSKRIGNLKRYYTHIVGNPPSEEQVKQWEAMDLYSFNKHYEAWSSHYSKVVFLGD